MAGAIINQGALTFAGGGTALANALSVTAVGSAIGLGLAAYALTRPPDNKGGGYGHQSSGYHKRQGKVGPGSGGRPGIGRQGKVNGAGDGRGRQGKVSGGKSSDGQQGKVSEGRASDVRQGKVSGGRANDVRQGKVSGGRASDGRQGKVPGGRPSDVRQGKVSGGRASDGRQSKVSGGRASDIRQGNAGPSRLVIVNNQGPAGDIKVSAGDPGARKGRARQGMVSGDRPAGVGHQGKSGPSRPVRIFVGGKPGGGKLGRQGNRRAKRDQQNFELSSLDALQYEEQLELQETLELIRQHDTAGCGKRLMCELGGMDQEQLSIEELSILNLVRPNGTNVRRGVPLSQASLEYLDAKTRGQQGEKCGNVFPLCTLNGKQLMDIINEYLP